MIWNSWNSWSSGSIIIPWAPNAAAKVWSEIKGKEFNQKEQRDIGPGEYRFACEINGDVDSTTKAYDVIENGNKWEVKAITVGHVDKKTGKTVPTSLSFRGSPGALDAFRLFSEVATTVSHLLSIFDDLSLDERKSISQNLNTDIKFEDIIAVLEDNRQAIMKSNISYKRTFGFKPKTKNAKRIIGLTCVLKDLSKAIERINYVDNQWYFDEIEVQHCNVKVNCNSIQQLKIMNILGIDNNKHNINFVTRILSKIDLNIISDTEKLLRLWNSVKASETFGKADYFVIIDNFKGYFPIKICDLDQYVKFTGISKDLSFVAKSII